MTDESNNLNSPVIDDKFDPLRLPYCWPKFIILLYTSLSLNPDHVAETMKMKMAHFRFRMGIWEKVKVLCQWVGYGSGMNKGKNIGVTIPCKMVFRMKSAALFT